MKEGGYYGSGRPENVAPGASMEVDFLDVPAEGTKPEPRAVPGTVPGATPAAHAPGGLHLKKAGKLSKEWGKVPTTVRALRLIALILFPGLGALFVPLLAVAQDPPLCDPNGPYFGALGDSIQFDGTGSMGDPPNYIVSYDWNFGDGGTGTGPTPQHVYSAPGQFTVSLTVTDNEGAQSGCTTTAVVSPPTPVDPATWGRIKAVYRTRKPSRFQHRRSHPRTLNSARRLNELRRARTNANLEPGPSSGAYQPTLRIAS